MDYAHYRQILDGLSEEARSDLRRVLALGRRIAPTATRWPLSPDDLPSPALYADTELATSGSILLDAVVWEDPDACVDEAVLAEFQAEARQILVEACDNQSTTTVHNPQNAEESRRLRKPSPEIVEWMAHRAAIMTRAVLDQLATLRPSDRPDIRTTYDADTILNIAEAIATQTQRYQEQSEGKASNKPRKRSRRKVAPAVVSPQPPTVRLLPEVIAITKQRLDQIYHTTHVNISELMNNNET